MKYMYRIFRKISATVTALLLILNPFYPAFLSAASAYAAEDTVATDSISSDTTDSSTEETIEPETAQTPDPTPEESPVALVTPVTTASSDADTGSSDNQAPQLEAVSEDDEDSEDTSQENIWNTPEEGVAVTQEVVTTGFDYKAPQNNNVVVRFKTLPGEPGTLTIKEIKLSKEEQKALGALSDTAYDITSPMENGTFTYDLTLPKPSNKQDVEVKYAETKGELDDAKTVTQSKEEKDDTITIKGLDHFTIFFPANTAADADSAFTPVTPFFLVESAPGDIGVGSLVLTAPAGFQFNTASNVTASSLKVADTCSDGSDKLKLNGINVQTVTPTATTITFNVTKVSEGLCHSRIHFAGIEAQPINANPLAMGDITFSGVTIASGVTTSSDNNSFVETVALTSAVTSTVETSDAVVESDGVDFAVITVTLKDAYGNPIEGKNVSLSQAGASSNITGPSPAVTDSNGQTTFTVTNTTVESVTYTAENTTDGVVLTDTAQVDFVDTIAPATPDLVSPADGAKVKATGLILDWSDETDTNGPVTYVYQSSLSSAVNGVDNGFISPIYTSGSLSASQINASGSSDNTYYWQTRSCDSLGNCSDWSGPWQVVIDSTAPVNPTVSSSSHTESVASADPTIDMNISGASDNLSGVAGFSFEWDMSPTTDPDETIDGDESLTSTTSPALATSDSHYFHLKTVDYSGNWSLPVHVGPFSVDVTAPNIPALLSPDDGDFIQKTGLVLDWSDETDPNGPVTYVYQSSLSSAVNGVDNGFISPIYTASLAISEIDASGTSDNTYYWQARACDSLGNCSDWAAPRELNVDSTAPSNPGAPSTSPNPTNALSQVWNWATSTDLLSGIARYDWRAFDGITTVTGSVLGNITTVTTNLTEGVWDFFVKAIDNAGNESDEVSGTVTVDTTPPAISLTPYTPDPVENSTPSYTGTVADMDLAGLASVQYRVEDSSNPGTPVIDWTDVDSFGGGVFNFTPAFLFNGTYTFMVRATDNAGNVSSIATDELTIDAAPIISNESVMLTSVSGTEVLITWTTDNDATSRVVYGTSPVADGGVAPNYGYPFSTALMDTNPKVKSHSVLISGLTPNTTYYFRAISSGSPETVSSEHGFELGAADNGNEGTGGGGTDSDTSDNDSSSSSGSTSTGKVAGATTTKPSSNSSNSESSSTVGTPVYLASGVGGPYPSSTSTSGSVEGTSTGTEEDTMEESPSPTPTASPSSDADDSLVAEPEDDNGSSNTIWYVIIVIIILGVVYYIYSRRE